MTQLDLFGNEVEIKRKPANKDKRNWENAFQRWSNDKGLNAPTEHYGKCGYGSMCDYCEDNTYGRPCVRALNEMCRDQNITLDYTDRNFEDVWCGEFNKRSASNENNQKTNDNTCGANGNR